MKKYHPFFNIYKYDENKLKIVRNNILSELILPKLTIFDFQLIKEENIVIYYNNIFYYIMLMTNISNDGTIYSIFNIKTGKHILNIKNLSKKSNIKLLLKKISKNKCSKKIAKNRNVIY